MDEFAETKKRFREFSDGDDQEAKGLVERFLQVLADNLNALEEALKSKDARKVGRAAHGAIGACDMFGVREIAGLLRQMEEAAGRGDLSGADAQRAKIRAEQERVRSGLI